MMVQNVDFIGVIRICTHIMLYNGSGARNEQRKSIKGLKGILIELFSYKRTKLANRKVN